MIKKLFLIATLLGAIVSNGYCQEDEDRNDRIEAMKIAFITEKLALTPDEAKVFWPVFNEFSTELKKIREKEKESALTFKAKANPTEQESNKFIADHFAFKQAQIDLSKKYSVEFKKVLPQQKVAKLLMLEQDFKQQLLQRLKNRQNRMQH
jgi:hypothetical protein